MENPPLASDRVPAGHVPRYGADGRLRAWTAWPDALEREMRFYRSCPRDRGYPRFVCETFLDGRWEAASERSDIIPATQNGMGILSYLKWFEFGGRRDGALLRTAQAMGDYLIRETLTPAAGAYPRFTRSTGRRGQFPLRTDCGSQADRPFETEPDKGGIAGHALLQLHAAGGDPAHLAQALHNARVLAAHQAPGDAAHSPWPFRVDHRDGTGRGPVAGNMSYVLRLYDGLIDRGVSEFAAPRAALWEWIHRFQIPSAAGDGSLFAQFFEDHDTPGNRTSWAPLNLARYLLERRDALDADWLGDAGRLIDFVRRNFTHRELGAIVCHEQDEDAQAWGGVNSTYGAVLAMYAAAAADPGLAAEARAALNFTLYAVDGAGRPRDLVTSPQPGGWQEDAHTDVIHNYVDALAAFPSWGEDEPA
jgi:hypothetical protein